MPTGSLGNRIVPFYGGGTPSNPPNVIVKSSSPSSSFVAANLGDLFVDTTTHNIYSLVNKASGVATWTLLGGATGQVSTETGDTGTATPASGNIKHAGTANQITTAASGATITYSLPSAITAPGSLTTTTTLTATLGDVTATNGNFVSSASGKGVSFNVVTASGAASGQVDCNGRVGSVTFTGVSIASNADLALVLGNTSITGASTRILYSWSGATTGSALSIKSIVNAAGTSTITMTNGDGVAIVTSIADITFDFIVLN